MYLLNNWQDRTVEDVFRAFDAERWGVYFTDDNPGASSEKPQFKDAEILLASYGTPDYD
jgi:hypothetical protein